MFLQLAKWAQEGNCDFILAETIDTVAEASLALKAIREVGLPSVVNICFNPECKTRDGYSVEEAVKLLKERGADVVGSNCSRGPQTILPILQRIRNAVEGPICGAPVTYRTTPEEPTFMTLTDKCCKTPWSRPFPTALEPFLCTRYETAEFAEEAQKMGVQIIGLCCGNGPHHTRSAAEALGRTTKRSRFTPNMSKHFMLGQGNNQAKEYVSWGKVMKGEVTENK